MMAVHRSSFLIFFQKLFNFCSRYKRNKATGLHIIACIGNANYNAIVIAFVWFAWDKKWTPMNHCGGCGESFISFTRYECDVCKERNLCVPCFVKDVSVCKKCKKIPYAYCGACVAPVTKDGLYPCKKCKVRIVCFACAVKEDTVCQLCENK